MSSTPATKGNLLAAKASRAQAKNGFDLMDRKRNILIRELMGLIDKAAELQKSIGTTFSDAYATMVEANLSTGGCGNIAGAVPIDNSLNLRYRSVMGVELTSVVSKAETDLTRMPYGFSGTSSALDDAYFKFAEVKELSLRLAETENAIYRLAWAIKKTQKRANALQNIVIPGLDADIARMNDELEEKEREEFTRLKVIKSRKV